MIALSPEAEAHIDRLVAHYEKLEQGEAAVNLLGAPDRARLTIATEPQAGSAAPRLYPSLARHGNRWIVESPYWISYGLTTPPVISGIFCVTADIPNRI